VDKGFNLDFFCLSCDYLFTVDVMYAIHEEDSKVVCPNCKKTFLLWEEGQFTDHAYFELMEIDENSKDD
jgi:hypothetical protein